MATRSMFFDAVNGDRSYDATSLAALLRSLVQRDGVVYGYNGGLAVSATSPASMAVTVATGAAFVQGRMFEVHTAAEQKAISAANPTYPRIDRVVVRLDNSSAVRSVSLAVKAGTPAASPVPPTLQRDATVWELSLAQIRVNAGATSITSVNITDERDNATVCGWTGPDPAKVSAFRVYQSTAQSIAAATITKVAFQTEQFDQLGEYDPSTYRFTAQKVGFYLFSATVEVAALDAGSRIGVVLHRNGAQYAWLQFIPVGATASSRAGGSTIIWLNAGDYVEVYLYLDAAKTTSPGAAYTYFTGIRIA